MLAAVALLLCCCCFVASIDCASRYLSQLASMCCDIKFCVAVFHFVLRFLILRCIFVDSFCSRFARGMWSGRFVVYLGIAGIAISLHFMWYKAGYNATWGDPRDK